MKTQGQIFSPQDQQTLQGIKGIFDMAKGESNIGIQIGPGYDTQREETQAFYIALAQAFPALIPRYADLWARSMDFPEKDELADRLMPPDIAMKDGVNPAAQLPALKQTVQQQSVMIQKQAALITQLTMENIMTSK